MAFPSGMPALSSMRMMSIFVVTKTDRDDRANVSTEHSLMSCCTISGLPLADAISKMVNVTADEKTSSDLRSGTLLAVDLCPGVLVDVPA